MNRALLATSLILSMGLAGSALAQTAPVGGPDAKGNAPLKHAHTVNDGSAKPGANSFTEGQARKHILNSGYTDVSPLAKGKDGVWRGTAMHNGAQVDVAMDFKGNVTEGGPAAAMPVGTAVRPATPAAASEQSSADAAAGAATAAATTTGAMAHHHHHRRRHHHMRRRCAHPGPNGVACSGIDRNRNGVSDKEDRAMQAGSHP